MCFVVGGGVDLFCLHACVCLCAYVCECVHLAQARPQPWLAALILSVLACGHHNSMIVFVQQFG